MTPAYAYGWGATLQVPSTDCPVGNGPAVPAILQETELRVCTADESAARGLVEGQLCAVSATSATYFVTIDY